MLLAEISKLSRQTEDGDMPVAAFGPGRFDGSIERSAKGESGYRVTHNPGGERLLEVVPADYRRDLPQESPPCIIDQDILYAAHRNQRVSPIRPSIWAGFHRGTRDKRPSSRAI